jgi:hypothetical protein
MIYAIAKIALKVSVAMNLGKNFNNVNFWLNIDYIYNVNIRYFEDLII